MQLVAYPELVVVVWEITLVEHSTLRSTLPVTTFIRKSNFLPSWYVSCYLRPHQLSIQGQRQIKTDIFNQSFSVNRYQFVELYQYKKLCYQLRYNIVNSYNVYHIFISITGALVDKAVQGVSIHSNFGHETPEKTAFPYIERLDWADSMDVITRAQSTAMFGMVTNERTPKQPRGDLLRSVRFIRV